MGTFQPYTWQPEIDKKNCDFVFSNFLYSCSFTGKLQNCTIINISSKRWMPIARDRGSIYKLWALRRKTLPWIYFLNKVSTPLSRSTMANVISCSCSSMQTTPLLKCLGDKGSFAGTWTAICFDRRYDKDSSVAIAISLSSANCLTL